ncbi:MAG: thioredoxin [Phycisphaerales bacterium]
MSEILHPNASTFGSEVLQSDLPVLVDFWAPWCPPCVRLKPIVESLAEEMTGRIRVATVNVDENPELATKYSIRSIPALMIVKGGQVVDSWVGYAPKPDLLSRLDPHVAAG